MDFSHKNIAELRDLLKSGRTSAVELLDFFINKIKQEDADQVDAFLEIFEDAEEQARLADERIKAGDDAPLLGVPVALKDNILYQGHIASAGSKILEDYVASYSATVVRKLQKAGAVIIGRTNMDEFAMGSSTETSAFKVTKNPNDPSRVPGGSSGGSAAAVAAGFVPFALGTDTGGSVRQPASFCGVVGFKPSYGAVSRFGLVAMGSSLDQAGPLTRTVSDTKLVFSILAGKDQNDATTMPLDMLQEHKTHKVKKVGVPRAYMQEGVDAQVLDRFNEAMNTLRQEGFEVVDIDLPSFDYALSAYYIIMPAEVSTNLARFDGLRYGLQIEGESYEESFKKTRAAGFGREVKRRILLGSFVLSSGYMDAYYYKAIAAREKIRRELADLFKTVDIIATPTSPTPAFKLGEKTDPLSMYAADIFTVPVNIAKVPAISVPVQPVSRDGAQLPSAVQFIAPEMHDFPLLDFAETFEKIYADNNKQ